MLCMSIVHATKFQQLVCMQQTVYTLHIMCVMDYREVYSSVQSSSLLENTRHQENIYLG